MSAREEQTNPKEFLDIAGGGKMKKTTKKNAIKTVKKTKKKATKKKVVIRFEGSNMV